MENYTSVKIEKDGREIADKIDSSVAKKLKLK